MVCALILSVVMNYKWNFFPGVNELKVLCMQVFFSDVDIPRGFN